MSELIFIFQNMFHLPLPFPFVDGLARLAEATVASVRIIYVLGQVREAGALVLHFEHGRHCSRSRDVALAELGCMQ